ncbi:protein-disulfide reductase DsbD domain-containing protein [Bacteroidota bacterium]
MIEVVGRMIRFSSLVLILAVAFQSASAQIFDPVKWSFTSERISETEAKLVFTAAIEDGWHLYANKIDGDGPVPTSFTFKDLGGAKIIGDIIEGKGHTEMDPNFGIELKYFEHKATFKQRVAVSAGEMVVKGEVEFMVCNNERCLPPDYLAFETKIPAFISKDVVVMPMPQDQEMPEIFNPVKWQFSQNKLEGGEYELVFKAEIEEGWHVYSQKLPLEAIAFPTVFVFDSLAGAALVGEVVEPQPISELDKVAGMTLTFFENEVIFRQKVKLDEASGYVAGVLSFMACDDEKCLAPEDVEFVFEIGEEVVAVSSTEPVDKSSKSWLGIFVAGFIGGLFALLTPCVFPMIPLTVSFFTKKSKSRTKGLTNALIYGLSIVLIYVGLGFFVTVTFGADALNAFSTNVWFNVFFFVLLVVFAISFLGAFEITMPSSWVNKADQASDRGGLLGIFFMAFTLSLVSFSCTGPIIGTLLVQAAVNGGVLGPILGMTGFSLALALPFGLFAAFPGWLNSLPKSGSWLNSVKVVLGLLELALALKFLSNADLVVQAGFLKRELFIAIWIGIFGTLALYLFGFVKFPHDSPMDKISVPRFLFGLVTLVFTIYLIPGLWGAPLKLISGFPPPMFYSESPNGLGGGSGEARTVMLNEAGDVVGDPEHCPHGLPCFHDYDQGVAYAKEAGKPILLDFTGWACVNCRKMEEKVWSDPRILKKLAEDFVLISLYVDEKTMLPLEEQIEVEIGGKVKKLRTVGNRWSHMQASRFGTNSQPYYVVLDHNEKQLGTPASYNPNIQDYIDWLNKGINAFKEGE